jgi:hypothetical protein
MAYSPMKVYRYLKFKDRFVSGIALARHMNIPLRQLEKAGEHRGVGSIGPVNPGGTKNRSAQFWQRYARTNEFCADFICFFRMVKIQLKKQPYVTDGGRYLCLKDRPLRKGANKPNKRRPKR